MLSGNAEIQFNNHKKSVRLGPLQIAEICAGSCGYYDVDLKDNDIGNYRLIAYGNNTSVQGKGVTLEAAVKNLLEKIL